MLDSERDSHFAARGSPDEVAVLRKKLLDIVSDLVATDTSLVPREVAKTATTDGGLSEALLSCMRAAYLAREEAQRIRLRDPTHAEALLLLSTQLQLCSAALVQLLCATDEDVENNLGCHPELHEAHMARTPRSRPPEPEQTGLRLARWASPVAAARRAVAAALGARHLAAARQENDAVVSPVVRHVAGLPAQHAGGQVRDFGDLGPDFRFNHD
eukprot:4742202-Prymnesium_polylepis.1